MVEANWRNADGSDDGWEMVPTRAPSVRSVLVTSAVVFVGLAAWAVAAGTWVPLLLSVPMLALGGPFPWRRFFYETRTGAGLFAFAMGGVTYGVFQSVIGESHHGIAAGLLFGTFMAGLQAITWKEERRRRTSRLRRWLSGRFASPS